MKTDDISCQPDLYCVSENRYYNAEIQRRTAGVHAHRARYYSSILNAGISFPGGHYEQLPDVYVIFITAKDIPGRLSDEKVKKQTQEFALSLIHQNKLNDKDIADGSGLAIDTVRQMRKADEETAVSTR